MAHELAKRLLEQQDGPVLLETFDNEWGEYTQVGLQTVRIDAEPPFSIIVSSASPRDLEEEREAREKADKIREQYHADQKRRQEEIQQHWGHLLP